MFATYLQVTISPGCPLSTPWETRLIDACEQLLCEICSIEELTARRVAKVAGKTASAVSYHFGSQEQLVDPPYEVVRFQS